MAWDPLLTATLVALLNGLFLFVGKIWLDRRLAEERAANESRLEALKSELTRLRELALRHFDRRADLYWAALEPFVQLYVVNLSRASTALEIEAFRREALLASSRLSLFATPSVSGEYTQLLEWTEVALAGSERFSAAEARERAQQFVKRAQDDLFLAGRAGDLPVLLT